ncbi:MAG: hypothetical protein HY690_03875 [Chloroflexi bacterium]|nr:hypothetical protein [Chloroflexota bacterium]
MFDVDLRRDRFIKVWRVTSGSVEATAAVIRRPHGFSAAVHCALPDGGIRTWRWPGQQGSLLTDREAVLSIFGIDRDFTSLPGTHVRIDFPQGSSHADQVVILMEYGLLDLAPGAEAPDDLELEEDCRFWGRPEAPGW